MGVSYGEADVYNGKPWEVVVAEWNEFCLLNVSGSWCKVRANSYRPITKQHSVLPEKTVSWIDLPKRFRKVAYKLFRLIVNLQSVRDGRKDGRMKNLDIQHEPDPSQLRSLKEL